MANYYCIILYIYFFNIQSVTL